MSSKQPQHITRANYEEFFLLYVDGELPTEGMDAVDAFVTLHPDLREELDLLLDTRLEAPALSFGDTASLLADRMRVASDEEALLLYVDNELPAAERAALELRLQQDALLRGEYAALAATRLDPADAVVFPDKASLYRRERERRPLIWWRAAAAVLVLGAGFAVWQNAGSRNTGSNATDGVLAGNRNTTVMPAPATGTVPPPVAVEAPQTVAVAPGGLKADQPANVPVMKTAKEPTARPANSALADTRRNAVPGGGLQQPGTAPILGVPDPRDRVQPATDGSGDAIALNEVPRTHRVDGGNNGTGLSQNLQNALVTKAPPPPYTSLNNATNPVATEAVVRSEDRPQGSFRGFLRKAARFVEKRTGIKTTNENDQLEVGAVAINLK